jgi:RNA polymerase sigma factor (TIGR02999 family)
MDPKTVTGLLHAWREGDAAALDQLIPLVYDDLHSLAGRYLRQERPDHTLQATALINEAYLRLADAEVPWQDRNHFLAIAARTMRRILVDHAKARRRDKRGGGQTPVTLEEALVVSGGRTADVVALDEALSELERLDHRKAQVIELHYFGGLTYREVAEVLAVSPATVDRDLRLAKSWLYTELAAGGDDT